nr:immunoglobulin light chain junction region [Homo sapiens]
LSTSKSLPL